MRCHLLPSISSVPLFSFVHLLFIPLSLHSSFPSLPLTSPSPFPSLHSIHYHDNLPSIYFLFFIFFTSDPSTPFPSQPPSLITILFLLFPCILPDRCSQFLSLL